MFSLLLIGISASAKEMWIVLGIKTIVLHRILSCVWETRAFARLLLKSPALRTKCRMLAFNSTILFNVQHSYVFRQRMGAPPLVSSFSAVACVLLVRALLYATHLLRIFPNASTTSAGSGLPYLLRMKTMQRLGPGLCLGLLTVLLGQVLAAVAGADLNTEMIAAGYIHTCYLTPSNGAWCWGDSTVSFLFFCFRLWCQGPFHWPASETYFF